MVAITAHGIRVDGITATPTPGFLYNLLRSKRELWQELHPAAKFPALVTLQVDRSVPAGVVKRAIAEATRAGYGDISFQVRRAHAAD